MTRRLFIASSSNKRLKALRRLARGGSRQELLVEGSRALRSALGAGVHISEVYSAPSLHLGGADTWLVDEAERRGACVHEVDASAFRTLARQTRPDGILAVVERPSTALAALVLPAEPLLVIAVGIERPGNLGTVVRTACASGADGLVVCDPCTDVFQRDVVRGSVGMIFHLPLTVATSGDAISWLRRQSIKIVAVTPCGARLYSDARYGGAIALVLGSERHGLPDEWIAAADETVAIPMQSPADSLNVGVAAGVVLFEAARLRDQARRRSTTYATTAMAAKANSNAPRNPHVAVTAPRSEMKTSPAAPRPMITPTVASQNFQPRPSSMGETLGSGDQPAVIRSG